MPKKERYQNRIELLQGTLDMLVLKTLQWGPQHGYAISQALRSRSGEVLQVETGSLYPALHRLERQGWVTAEWKKSESNQRAKFYRITRWASASWRRIMSAGAGWWRPLKVLWARIGARHEHLSILAERAAAQERYAGGD
jgi:PadR family transcriptional regulator, regulatory protein PadR